MSSASSQSGVVPESRRILLVDDDRDFVEGIIDVLESRGFVVKTAYSAGSAADRIKEFDAHIALLDMRLGTKSGIDLIGSFSEARPGILCVMMTAYASVDTAVEALQRGAYDYLRKPLDMRELLSILDRCFEKIRLEREKVIAEAALRESEQRYRMLFERAGDAMFISRADGDNAGEIVAANPAAAAMHEYSLDELLTMNVLDLNPGGQEKVPPETNDNLTKGVWIKDEHYHVRKDGTVFPVELTAGLIELGNEEYVYGINRDLTETKKAQEMFIQTERIKAVAEMAGGVAHNFNNVLQIVVGGVQLALMSLNMAAVDDVKKHLESVLESAKLGAQTVKRLQDFARVRTEDPTQEGKVFDVSNTVAEATETSRPWWKTAADREGITISLNRYLRTGCLVKGNEHEIFEVVVNLIKNSVEAMPQGGEIKLRTSCFPNDVTIVVEDNGVGINHEDLGKVFEPFWTSKGVNGTGMGLASSYGIIQRHGGQISVESQPGEGTIVTVRLPYIQDAAPQSALHPVHSLNFTATILVVDDLQPVVLQLEKALTKFGQRVLSAYSGSEAVELFEKNHADLVICDLGMPKMNGWQVARSVKELCERKGIPKTPFIILTGWGGQVEDPEKMAECGVDTIVEKPVDVPKLLELIQYMVTESSR